MRRPFIALLPLLMLLVAEPASAGIFDSALKGVLQPIERATLGTVLDDVKNSANDVVDHAKAQADGLVVKTANETNLFAANVGLEYKDALNTTIGDLDRQQQEVVARLQGAKLQLDQWISQAYDLRNTTVVNVAQLEAGLPFTHVSEFFVQQVDGISYLPHPGDYTLTLYAQGVGITDDGSSSIEATLNGKPLAIADPDISTLGKAVIKIPGTALAPLFAPDALVTPKLVLKISVPHRGFLGIGLFGSKNTYTVPVYLNLYPHKAGTAVVRSVYPVYGWVSAGTEYGDQITVPDRDGCRHEDCEAHNVVTVRVAGVAAGDPIPGNQRIAKLWLECTSNNSICNFRDSILPVTSLNGTLGTITFNTNSHSVTFRADAQVEVYKQTGVATLDASGDLGFGEQTQFTVPSKSVLDTVSFTGFSKLAYQLPLLGPDSHGIVSFVSRSANAAGPDKDIVILTAAAPSGVQ